MAQVSITVNNRAYTVACEDGQEPRLNELAEQLDKEVSTLAKAIGQVGDSRLLVISGLSLIDQMLDLRQQVASLNENVSSDQDKDDQALNDMEARALSAEKHAETLEGQLKEAIRRIEALAASLQQS